MLKLGDLYHDLRRLAADSAVQSADRAARRALAVEALHRHSAAPAALRDRAAAARTSWLIADCPGVPDAVTPAPAGPPSWSVVAVDGSQIFPDRHGLAACYLLNLGLVHLTYGDAPAARLDSEPRLFADEADLYRGQQADRLAVTAAEVGIHRAVLELERLLDLAREAAASGHPVVALADGTLIPWGWAQDDDDYRARMLDRWFAALAGFAADGLPVVSYISRTGGADVTHLVRVGECDQSPVNCDHCPHLSALTASQPAGRCLPLASAVTLPCGTPAGLVDADLFAALLPPGARSEVFVSRSRLYVEHEEQRTAFCYLGAGDEIARLEMPVWVARQPEWLARVHAVVADQVAKGRGYPVALVEAHEQAVIRSPDRAAFERLLERALVDQGAAVRWSAKGRAKQQPGV